MKIFIVMLSMLAFIGCTVTSEKWERCSNACENNGGVSYIRPDRLTPDICRCKNGAKFDI